MQVTFGMTSSWMVKVLGTPEMLSSPKGDWAGTPGAPAALGLWSMLLPQPALTRRMTSLGQGLGKEKEGNMFQNTPWLSFKAFNKPSATTGKNSNPQGHPWKLLSLLSPAPAICNQTHCVNWILQRNGIKDYRQGYSYRYGEN